MIAAVEFNERKLTEFYMTDYQRNIEIAIRGILCRVEGLEKRVRIDVLRRGKIHEWVVL